MGKREAGKGVLEEHYGGRKAVSEVKIFAWMSSEVEEYEVGRVECIHTAVDVNGSVS